MTTPDEDARPTRAALERVAFGRAQTPAEVAAAHDALRRLVEADAAKAAAARAAAELAAVPEIVDVDYGPAPSEPEPARRRRSLVPLLVVVGLLAGAVIGIVATRPELVPTTPGSGASTSPTPAPTPNAAAALKSLLVPQTKADKGYPFLADSGRGALQRGSGRAALQPASVHRITTAPDGAVLWVGRSDTGICMMWSRTDATDSGIAGATTCDSPGDFEKDGLTLSDGTDTWSWNGIYFTTTLGD
jgi:hypothetical protein